MAGIDLSKYAHSPVHLAVAVKDYAGLRKILSGLPQFCKPSEIRTESVSLVEEHKAKTISSVIDRCDVPNRDSPLHLAVKLSDATATAMLMVAGADWNLQNEQGWSALEEAICNREEGIARIIVRHYQPLAWARWYRTLPQLIGTMRKMRDFYVEIAFHFECSLIPFTSSIAPSDTLKIWKRGANLRADLTVTGFDGFRIQHSDQSILFLGDGSEDGKLPPGSLWKVSHNDKQVIRDDDDASASDAEVRRKVASMSECNVTREWIDVTEAVLLPQLTWRRKERTEMVGPWKAKAYDMHNMAVTIKSRNVSGAMIDDNLSFHSGNKAESEELDDPLTEEEKRQLEVALKLDSSDLSNGNGDEIIRPHNSCYEQREIPTEDIGNCGNGQIKQEKQGWFGGWRKRDNNHDGQKRIVPPRSSIRAEDTKTSTNSKSGKPVIWLSRNFPFLTEELLPLLDIMANRIKTVCHLRELLTTKFPAGTFPVKVAIPLVPIFRMVVTFTKFEELQPEDKLTPVRESPEMMQSSSSACSSTGGSSSRVENIQDLFAIPPDYEWVTAKENRKKVQEKGKSKRGRNQNQ